MKKTINLPALLLSSSLTALNFLAFTTPLQEANATKHNDLGDEEVGKQRLSFSDCIIRTYEKSPLGATTPAETFGFLKEKMANHVKIWNWSEIFQSLEHILPEDQIQIKLSEFLAQEEALNAFLKNNNNTVVVDITPTEDEIGPIHLELYSQSIPNNLKHLSFFCNSNRDIAIEDEFLKDCEGLISLDLSGLSNEVRPRSW